MSTIIRGGTIVTASDTFAADLLIEVDDDLKICFALGATSGLTSVPDAQLPGRSLDEIVAEADRQYVATLLGSLKPASRCGPVLVRLSLSREDGSPRDALLNASPMKRLGEPEEVGLAVAWLCSDESSFVNGQGLALDGGLTAW